MLKVAVIVLIVMLAYAGVYSLMSVIVPRVMMGSTFTAITGKALDSIQDAGYLKALSGRQRNVGLYALTTVIAGFFFLFVGFQKAQRWAWCGLLVVGSIAWLWGLIYSLVIGDKVNSLLMAIGMVIFLVGLLIPIKEFFGKEAKKLEGTGQ